MAKVLFNGPAREIAVISGTVELDAQIDLYSDWKEWVKDGDNSKYLPAFRTTAGDDIGGGKAISPYFFIINNWVIRPADADHTLLIAGNLYSDPAANDIVVPATGAFTVNVVLERAVDAITTTVSGSGGGLTADQDFKLTETYQTTGDLTSSVSDVLTSQSLADADLIEIITSQSLADASGSLSPDQANQLLRLYEVMGLDPTKPLVVTPRARTVASDISQSIETSGDTVTVTSASAP